MNVLVTLGNRMNDDGTLSDKMLARLQKTLEVQDDFDVIVVTGGIANQVAGKAEGDEMYKWLVANGVEPSKIVVENKSLTTKENAKYCRQILQGLGVKEVTLLSSQYHIDRKWLNPIKLFKRHAKVNVIGAIRA